MTSDQIKLIETALHPRVRESIANERAWLCKEEDAGLLSRFDAFAALYVEWKQQEEELEKLRDQLLVFQERADPWGFGG